MAPELVKITYRPPPTLLRVFRAHHAQTGLAWFIVLLSLLLLWLACEHQAGRY